MFLGRGVILRLFLAHVIIVSPPVQIGILDFDFFLRGLDLGLGLDNNGSIQCLYSIFGSERSSVNGNVCSFVRLS